MFVRGFVGLTSTPESFDVSLVEQGLTKKPSLSRFVGVMLVRILATDTKVMVGKGVSQTVESANTSQRQSETSRDSTLPLCKISTRNEVRADSMCIHACAHAEGTRGFLGERQGSPGQMNPSQDVPHPGGWETS